jgi:hypothetical protein
MRASNYHGELSVPRFSSNKETALADENNAMSDTQSVLFIRKNGTPISWILRAERVKKLQAPNRWTRYGHVVDAIAWTPQGPQQLRVLQSLWIFFCPVHCKFYKKSLYVAINRMICCQRQFASWLMSWKTAELIEQIIEEWSPALDAGSRGNWVLHGPTCSNLE